MGIIEDSLMKNLGGLCIQNTLINDIINEITILVMKICEVLNNHAMFIVTIVIKG
jgi:hypothetical protein